MTSTAVPLPGAAGLGTLPKTCRTARQARLQEVELFEGPTDDGLRIHFHPLLQQGGVQAAEIVVEVEVPLQQFPRLERWILGVQSTLHRVADDPGNATGT